MTKPTRKEKTHGGRPPKRQPDYDRMDRLRDQAVDFKKGKKIDFAALADQVDIKRDNFAAIKPHILDAYDQTIGAGRSITWSGVAEMLYASGLTDRVLHASTVRKYWLSVKLGYDRPMTPEQYAVEQVKTRKKTIADIGSEPLARRKAPAPLEVEEPEVDAAAEEALAVEVEEPEPSQVAETDSQDVEETPTPQENKKTKKPQLSVVSPPPESDVEKKSPKKPSSPTSLDQKRAVPPPPSAQKGDEDKSFVPDGATGGGSQNEAFFRS